MKRASRYVGFLRAAPTINKTQVIAAVFVWLIFSFSMAYGEEGKRYWSIQVGSYKYEKSAKKDLLTIQKFPDARVERTEGPYPYKLFIGRFEKKGEAHALLSKAKKQFPKAYKVSRFYLLPETAAAPKKIDPVRASTEVKVFSLEDLGYAKDIFLPGAVQDFSFYFANYKGLKRVHAEIVLKLSDVLAEDSSITVLVDNIPQFTRSVKQMGYAPTLSFEIKPSGADYTKISVRGHLNITGDICYDMPTGNLWMVISNKSHLRIEHERIVPNNVSNFFRNYESDLNTVMTSKPVGFGALPLFYYLHQLNDWKKTRLSVSDQPIPGIRNILVGNYSKDIQTEKGDLFVSEKGVRLLKKSFIEFYITPSLTNSVIEEEEKVAGEVRFSDIGIKDFNATGIGDLSFNVPFRYSFFAGIPKNLNLKLKVNHTPIPENDRAFLKVFFNGILIKGIQLTEGGNLQTYDIPIPQDLLEGGYANNLNVVGSYSVNRGNCKGSLPQITFSVLDSSSFYYADASREKIRSVIDVMGSLSGKVLLIADNPNLFSPGVSLMDLLGKFNKDIPRIDVVPWTGAIPEGYDFVLLLLNPENTVALNTPLKLHQGRFSIINPLTQKEVFNPEQETVIQKKEIISSEYRDGFGVLQTFNEGDSKVLLLSYYKELEALKFLKTFDIEKMGAAMNGNVVIFNQDIASYEIGEKFRVIYPEVKSLSYYWEQVKLPIILGIGVIVMLFLYLVNKRLVRKQ